MSTIPAEIEQAVQEARDDFDLGATLTGAEKLTRTVRVFTDKEAGAELGGVEHWTDTSLGFPRPQVRHWGIAGKIIELSATDESKEENAAEIAELRARVVELSARLEATAITLELRSFPPIVKKISRKAAKKELGITGKVGPDHALWEEYVDEEDAQLLHHAVKKWVRAEDGVVRGELSLQNARALKGRLEEYEYAKIVEKLNELLFTRQIAQNATEDADF